MIVSVKRLTTLLRLFLLFVVTTLIFYTMITYFSDVIKPSNPYRKPEGRAVKVMKEEQLLTLTQFSYAERLKLYYWIGE